VTDDLAVVVEDGRLLVRRGDSTVEVLPREVRRLVDALVEGAAGFCHERATFFESEIEFGGEAG
jgi:hypothetical protein